ncbi:uncharacterized protein METZ01_LOCUS323853, partial [marine metagenome]
MVVRLILRILFFSFALLVGSSCAVIKIGSQI